MTVVLFGPPLVLALGMALARAGAKRQWLVGLAAFAVAQLAVLALVAPGSEFSATFGLILLVSVVVPWVLAGGLLAFSNFPRNAVLVAIGIPVVYFAAWAIGAFIGLSTGALPK
jgi:hypothetical protein